MRAGWRHGVSGARPADQAAMRTGENEDDGETFLFWTRG